MAAAFHHGTETIRIDGGSSPVYTVDGAITAIVGTGMAGPVNEITVCQTAKDFAQFGTVTGAGFTLPDAAAVFTRYQSGIAYVVNVLDPTKHKTSVTGEALVVDADTLSAKTKKPGLLKATLKDGATTLQTPKDYTIDLQNGEIVFVAKLSNPSIDYEHLDPSKVTEADIIGAYVAATGKRTGLQALQEGFNRFGADAKIIICPEYDKTATCAAAMITAAEQLKAIAYISGPKGTTLGKALEGRGSKGSINFNTGSDRAQLFYP